VEEGVVVAYLDEEERTVFARIAADVGLLLSGDVFGLEHEYEVSPPNSLDIENLVDFDDVPVRDPDDPALLRIFPKASRSDADAAQEFRRYTEKELRDAKVSRLRLLWEYMSREEPRWELPREECDAILGAFTDIRMVLSARL